MRHLSLILVSLLVVRTASADLDIERAGKDAHGYTQQGQQAGFCTHPSKMSKDGDRLCPLSGDTSCEGFQKFCKDQTYEPHAPKQVDENDDGFSRMFAGLARVLLWVMIAAVAIIAIVLVAQALRRAREDKRLADAKPVEPKLLEKATSAEPEAPPITDAELLLRRAQELDAAGNHERALFTYLEASLRALDTRGALRIAKDRTYGEYVRGCKEAVSKLPLGEIVREVDRVKFGGAEASAEASSRAGERAVRLVRAIAATLALAMCVIGCGSKDQLSRNLADDPAGMDVLEDLLKRQGIEAGPLRGSLARLPMPTDEEDTPAVMVDFSRTKIDEGTRTHLMEWARAGGTLIITSSPSAWPNELAARYQVTSSTKVTATVISGTHYDDDDNEITDTKTYTGKVAVADAIEMKCDANDPQSPQQNTLAWIGDDKKPFAAFCFVGDGIVIGVANDDLFTNVGMMPPGNAEVAFAILSRLRAHELRIAQPMDGIEPPSSPITSIDRAGLGLGMWHALAAALVLFFAMGARLSRAAKSPPDERRAFTEHVEATGLVYARAKAASHALAAFAKFADERLRGMMPRGVNDPAAFLAMRSGSPADECERVWKRAISTKAGEQVTGDELETLRKLTALYANAVRRN